MKFNREQNVQRLLLVVAFSAIASLLLIAVFIFKEGVPFILKVGLARVPAVRRLATASRAVRHVSDDCCLVVGDVGCDAHRRAAGRRRRDFPERVRAAHRSCA